MRKSLKMAVLSMALASASTTYVSCSTATGKAFRDAAIGGAAGVIEETVAGILSDLLAPLDEAE